MNGLKTALLLGLLSGLLLVGGQAIGGKQGLYIGFAMALVMNFASYFFSDKIALSSYGAQPVNETDNREIYGRLGPLTRSLCERMGLPMPKLWVTPEDSPNAFATGRNPQHASVAVTSGLLELMNDRELEGVIAHELGHVKNRDILVSSVAATIGSAITMLAHFGYFFGGRSDDDDERASPVVMILMMLLAPLAAGLIQMAISRTREFGADAAAAKATGGGEGLAQALAKLEGWSQRIPMHASQATAHMFIIKPFSGASFARLFSTHPSTEERIRRIRALR